MSILRPSIIIPRHLRDLPAFQNASKPIQDKMALFLWLILCSGSLKKGRQIHSDEFARWGLKRYAKAFREQLSSIVECDERYSRRNPKYAKCLSFRFRKHISEADLETYEPQSKTVQDLCERPMPQHLAKLHTKGVDLPVHEKLAHDLQYFSLQEDEILPVLQRISPLKREIAKRRVWEWKCGSFFFVVGGTRRVYTSAANMNKTIRPYFWVNGERACEIDVSGCQPVLLSLPLKDRIAHEELSRWVQLTQFEDLYEAIVKCVGSTRPMIKRAYVKWQCGPWFEDVPRRKPNKRTPEDEKQLYSALCALHKWMKKEFPGVVAYMKAEKTNPEYRKRFDTPERKMLGKSLKPYAIIAERLQKLEAKIVIETCCAELLRESPEIPILTIHDGLVIPGSKGEFVRSKLSDSFMKFDLRPKISIKDVQCVRRISV